MLASIAGIVITKRCTLQSWAWCNGDTEPRTLLRCLQGVSPSLTGVPRTKGWQRVLNIKMVDFPWHIWVVENIQTLLIFVPIPDAFIISDSPYDITYPFKPKAIHTPKMGTKLYETNHISIGTITPVSTNRWPTLAKLVPAFASTLLLTLAVSKWGSLAMEHHQVHFGKIVCINKQ